jgi:hypothetical protein
MNSSAENFVRHHSKVILGLRSSRLNGKFDSPPI